MTKEDKFINPLSKEVMILDDPEYTMENGVVVRTPIWRSNLDYWVVRGGGEGFGIGDRVVLDDPMVGRKVKLDGINYRLVPVESVIGIITY